jgi:FkbM family methyltransferase
MGRPSQWHGTNSENECIQVETVALDDFFSGMDARPSLVEMDIEGAEPLALRGMQRLLAVTSAVILEMNPDHLDARGSWAAGGSCRGGI